MVVVRLQGGLGNQMFQYAAGRAVAHRLDAPLFLDVSSYPDIRGREYLLGAYPIRAEIATEKHIASFPPASCCLAARLWRAGMERFRRRQDAMTFCEPHYHYASAIESLSGDVYLDGYWQSWRYFESVSDEVAEELTLASTPPEGVRQLAEEVRRAESVSVHVRRGDYVDDATLDGLYNVLTPEWYKKAAGLACEGLSSPRFYVFSDNPDWARENLDLGAPMTVVDHTEGNAREDMRLMQMCRRHIIANSSFSWWGAWLDRRGGMVVAPKTWFGPGRRHRKTEDLYPLGWRRV